jgi:hypothetical protein
MLLSGLTSRRSWLRALIIVSAIFAMTVFLIPQASAEDTIFYDGFVYDTDGVTPVKAMVIVYDSAYPSGICTSTFMDGYWPYGYYLIKAEKGTGDARRYAYTYNTGDPDHSYMDRKSQEVVDNLDGLANGSYVTRNLILQALPHEPDPTVTFRGHITRSGMGVAYAQVFVSYGSNVRGTTADSQGYYNFQLSYLNRQAEMWASYQGYESPHWSTATTPGGVVEHDWVLPSPSSTPTPTPSPTPAPTPVPINTDLTFTGHVYNENVPVKDASFYCSYGGFLIRNDTNGSGYYRVYSIYRSGTATLWVTYNGNKSENYMITLAPGLVVNHDFYFNNKSTPVKNDSPAATSAPGNGTASVTTGPTLAVSASPQATPDTRDLPHIGTSIDMFKLLKDAGIIVGAIIVVLLVLYCLAILLVTRL